MYLLSINTKSDSKKHLLILRNGCYDDMIWIYGEDKHTANTNDD